MTDVNTTLFQWTKNLEEQKSFTSVIEHFFSTCPVPVSYFSYDSEKGHLHLLRSTKSLNPPSFSQCIRLYESDPLFDPSQLFQPENLPFLNKILQKTIGVEFYNSYHLLFRDQIKGLFIGVWNKEPYKSLINTQLFILHQYLKQLFWEQTWKTHYPACETVNCLNPNAFLKYLFIEVSRSRHLQLPLSLILMEIDSYDSLTKLYGSYKMLVLKKAILSQLTMENRPYDTISTWPKTGRLGILLPYTPIKTAKQKAEKIRSQISKADFSKVFPKHPHISVSLGLGEYPGVARSADSLLKMCLKALKFASGRCNGDLIAVASPSSGFKPDFLTIEKRSETNL